MPLNFSDDQKELAGTVRRFLAKRSPETEVRRLMATTDGLDADLWRELADGIGACGLMVPSELGGAGCSFVEVAVVLEELGRSMACLPYFSTVVLAQTALLTADDPAAAAEYLPGLASGERRASVAFVEPGDRWGRFAMNAWARCVDGAWQLSGTKTQVLDGHSSDLLLVFAATADGPGLFAVSGDATGLTRTPLSTVDLTRKQCRLDLVEVPGRLVGQAGRAGPVLDRVLLAAAVGLAVEQLGGAQRVLDMAVDYARLRSQFGRPIGSFQAIKNKCVDIFIDVESSRVAAYEAVAALAENRSDLPAVASLAKAYCSDAFWSAACENIQVHGGIGFTWEHPAHLYYRRAKTSQLMFGPPAYHRDQLARHLGV